MTARTGVAAELGHVDAWVFDLDNTLYPPTVDLFAQIDARMKAFIARELGLAPDDAFALQKRYYRQHGTTLRGLMLNHGTDPETFLEFVHDIDHSVLDTSPRLAAALAGLPGRRFVYTNGSARHARAVLDRLGVTALFDGVYDIRAGNYIPKPDPAPYVDMTGRFGIAAGTAAMFEDSAHNLKPAAALGMTTVWVRHPDHSPAPAEDLSHCHHVTDDLVAWLEGVAAS
ncbi:MAG: pyrimidine 5'-nucleotidase [Rhodospirillaceae bacterium]|nr:pyrimidine 5'-nucleotidase [Rhodospirillaceae bacterium]